MFFVMKKYKNLAKKNNLLPTSKNFILKDLNKNIEYLWSMCQKHKTKTYEAKVLYFIWPCFAINDFMSLSTTHFLRVFVVTDYVIKPI